MASYVPYTPDTPITRAMFNFDVSGIDNFRLEGTVRISVSDSFSQADYLSGAYSAFDSDVYSAHANEVAWTAGMTANVQEIAGIFSQFAGIAFEWAGDFDEAPPGSDSTPNPEDVGRAALSDINISWIYRSDVTFAGVSGINSDGAFGYQGGAGDIFLNEWAFGDLSLGLNTRARQTLMHEMGHSLGLSHPHSAYNQSTDTPTITLDYGATRNLGFSKLGFRTTNASDMYKEYFSIMSYDDQQSLLPSGGLFHSHTPMILDVIALQQAYGEGPGTTGAGNDTIAAGTAGYRTYFDQGGIDTIDLSRYSDGAYLRMGEQILGADHLVGVAMSLADGTNLIARGTDPANLRWFYGAYENAIGASHADLLYGNSLDNRIRGAGGNDTIYGGSGSDTAIFDMGRSAYTITKAGPGATVAGADGTDMLDGVERLQFSDALIRLGVPIVDFDGQGKTDVLIRHDNGTIEYRLMNGTSMTGFKDDAISNAWSVIGIDADFNGDGKSDVVLRNVDGRLEYRLMNGVSLTALKDDPIPTYWSVVSTDSDLNGDGKSDVLIRNANGTLEYRLMDGVNMTAFRDDAIPTYWSVVSADSDLNGDGKSDIVLRHTNGTLEYRLMDGVNLIAFKDEPIPTYWSVVSADSDFNGDGKSDIVLRHTNGTLEYRLMDGANMTAFQDDPIPTYWSVVSTEDDLNGDARSDVILRHDNGTLEYRLMNGLSMTAFRDDALSTAWRIVSSDNDLNADGKSDLILRHSDATVEYRLMDGLTVAAHQVDPIPAYWHLSADLGLIG